MAPRVDVGVVTWNTAELTVTALRALLDADQGCELRLLVHDNASDDGTPARLAEAVPEAEVEVCPRNLGFAGGVNRLLERSDAPWFVTLNSDAWPEPGALGRLVAHAERRPRAAAVAPLLLRPDGAVEHSTHPFPSPAVALVDAVGGRAWMPRRRLEALCLEGAWAHDRPRTVDWAVGAALLLRRDAVDDLGGLDERFFMYVEDVEWCARARRRGWEVRFEPSAVVRHVGNASGARRFGETRAALDAGNLRAFLREAHGPATAGLTMGLSALASGERFALARLRRRPAEAAYWRTQLRAQAGWDRPEPPARGSADSGSPTTGPPDIGGSAPPGRRDAGTWAPDRRRRSPSPSRQPSAPDPVGVVDRRTGTPPAVSVVVSTRGRARLLPRLVAALGAQTLPPDTFELVVVDDASPDDTTGVLERLAATAAFSLRVQRLPTRSGPAAGRNAGWRVARAPVVAFTDDDCVPAPDWLESGLAALDGEARVVVGRTEPPPDQLAAATRPFARVLRVDGARFFETCNAFYRRADLEAASGFDERFRYGGEDTDLGLRAVAAGLTPVFAPEALVHHDVAPGTVVDAVRNTARYVDLPLVVRRHPAARAALVHRRVFWKRTHPSAIAAAVGLVVALWPGGRGWAVALLVPWLGHRLLVTPACPGPLRRVAALPGALAVDLCEVGVMARGSVRHRTVLL